MKVIFMGTPEFAVPTLTELIGSAHEVLAVFTQPDRPKGRGKKMQFTPVKEKAVENDIDVWQPEKIKTEENVERIKAYQPDCIVVVAYGQILSKEILDIPKYGCVNVHASLLPKYRGAAPINWAIIEGEKTTGITTMMMAQGLDTGDMLLKKEVEILKKDAATLFQELSVEGGRLLIETLDALEAGSVTPQKQEEEKASYASMLNKQMGEIDWENSAEKIDCLIRGMVPWPSAYTYYEGVMLKIWENEILDKCSGEKPGTILSVSKAGIEVATATNDLLLKVIQFPNKKRMLVEEYLKGNPIQTGLILGLK